MPLARLYYCLVITIINTIAANIISGNIRYVVLADRLSASATLRAVWPWLAVVMAVVIPFIILLIVFMVFYRRFIIMIIANATNAMPIHLFVFLLFNSSSAV